MAPAAAACIVTRHCCSAAERLACLLVYTLLLAYARFNYRSTTLQADLVYTLDDKVIRAPMQPVSNFILVKVRDSKSLSAGGIVLPDQSADKPAEAEVVAAGPGRIHPHTAQLIPMCVKPGDKVMYSKYAGKRIKYNGYDHSFITDDDLLLVFEGEKVTPDSLKMVKDQVNCSGHNEQASWHFW